jgi:hypothetical protein
VASILECKRPAGARSRGRINFGPAQWRSLWLFVVKDFADIRVSTITAKDLAAGNGEILIERDAFRVAHDR